VVELPEEAHISKLDAVLRVAPAEFVRRNLRCDRVVQPQGQGGTAGHMLVQAVPGLRRVQTQGFSAVEDRLAAGALPLACSILRMQGFVRGKLPDVVHRVLCLRLPVCKVLIPTQLAVEDSIPRNLNEATSTPSGHCHSASGSDGTCAPLRSSALGVPSMTSTLGLASLYE
jgi:hypothetical protein